MDAGEVTIESPVGALSISRATVDHAPGVRALRNDLARWMRRQGIRQWRPGEVSVEWIELCIAFGLVHVISHDERVIGSVTIVWDDPLIWGERPEPAGYIHMLMLDRLFAGHGIGRSILECAERAIGETGRGLARLDCPTDNKTLRTYYEGAGYRFVEDKAFPHIDDAFETALYEKRLSP